MRTSINIKYDRDNVSLLNSYHATSSHSAIIKSVLSGTLKRNNSRAHIAYGPYGSGKSYIALILSMILEHKIPSQPLNSLLGKYENVDTQISSLIKDASKSSSSVVITLNGYKGSLKEAIVSETIEKLEEQNIRIKGYSNQQEILDLINLWIKNAPSLLQQFLAKEEVSLDKLIEQVESNNPKVISAFEDYYFSITGENIKKDLEDVNLISFLEFVTKSLKKQGLGLVIIYDEFGRFLDQLKQTDTNRFFQELQDMAELANSGTDNFSLLLIAHKPIGHYFLDLSISQRNEFAKIEKRFTVNQIDSDFTTYLSILNSQLENVEIDKRSFQEIRETNSKYGLFPSLNDTERDNLVYKGAYPMHPTSVFLLPRISKVFGQNERTLFSFMNDDNEHGLKKFLRNKKGFYLPDQLVDYFFFNIDASYIETYREFEIYTANIDVITTIFASNEQEHAKRIYKFAMLWSLANGNSHTLLTSKFISDSLMIDENHVNILLDKMSSARLMRFHELQGYWQIIESSGLDIDGLIQQQVTQLKVNREQILKELDHINAYKFIYSTKYNNDNEITRFASLSFSDQVVNADIVFKVNFSKEKGVKNQIITSLKYEDIEKQVKSIVAIDKLLKMNKYKDIKIQNELIYEKEIVQQQLDKQLQSIISRDSIIYVDNNILDINTYSELEKFLSVRFDAVYPEFTTINNDQINMYQLTVVQKNAVQRVITELIEQESIELANFYSGSRPDDLIWYSIYQMNKSEVRKFILNHIKKGSGSINELFHSLQQPPYGYRPYVALLLLLFVLLEEWRDIHFIQNNVFIADLSGEDYYDFLINEKPLDFQYSHFDSENRKFLEELHELFPNESTFVANKSLNIRVCSGLNQWYLKLPIITQQKISLNIIETTFLRYIEVSKSDPQGAIEGIIRDFENIEEVRIVKNSVEESFERFKKAELRKVLEIYNIDGLDDWAYNQKDEIKKTNNLVNMLLHEGTVFKTYAKNVESLDIHRWPKSTFDKFFSTIAEDIEACYGEVESNVISLEGSEKTVVKTDLSNKAKVLKRNIVNTINATMPYLREVEIEQIVYDLMNEYIK